MKRIAVDTGGTFTDIVYIDEEDSKIVVDKVHSTPRDVGEAVLNAIKKIKVNPADVDLFIHGTTAALNTVVEKKGAKIGLIATRGFSDVLGMGRGDKKDLYDYMWKKPSPLVPRHLRLGIDERTSHSGEVLKGVDGAEIRQVLSYFKEKAVESIAVCLLHSYVNPENELRVGEIIRQEWPEVSVSLSHQVAREIREYERSSTVAINAYIEKAVVAYINRLSKNLKKDGFRGQMLVLGPSGVLGTEAVKAKPISCLASGPIGGAAGAAHVAKLCGIKDVVTMDVGGTSFDVSLIKDGLNIEKQQTEVMGYPVLMPCMDIRPIGAGGGSIARVDEAGLLTVGPDSAGAMPGPMAYDNGGTEPTVTDAAIVSGLIDPDYFIGGEVKLNRTLAEKGVGEIAEKLGLGINETAEGILSIARNGMTQATTEILIGQGFDPRDFTLFSYGGGGGLFAAGIAKEMGISRVIVPTAPGVFSARGITAMNLVHSYVATFDRYLEKLDIVTFRSVLKEMEADALKMLRSEGILENEVVNLRAMDICYEGQRYHIETPIYDEWMDDEKGLIQSIKNKYEDLYKSRFGHLADAPLKIINIRLRAIGRIKDVPLQEAEHHPEIPKAAIKKSRRVFLEGEQAEVRIYERAGLLHGNCIPGPAVVEEPFHTTVIMSGQELSVDRFGNLIIRQKGGENA